MSTQPAPSAFGLIIVGGEILDGRRVAVRRLLSQGDTSGTSRRGVSGTDTRVE